MKKLGLILPAATLLLLSPMCLVKAENWVEVARFHGGNGGLVVSEEHFACDYGEWRIRWEFSLSKFSSVFLPQQYTLTVVTYREGEESEPVAPRIYEMANGTRSGTSYVHDSYGRYYMLIRSTGLESYTITIEQNTEYTQEPTPTPTSTSSRAEVVCVGPPSRNGCAAAVSGLRLRIRCAVSFTVTCWRTGIWSVLAADVTL
jgi:hypothetical protein